MARPTGHSIATANTARGPLTKTSARVALLIPTHALPPLSYSIPEYLRGEVRNGSVVAAPLSGYSRLGVVVGVDEEDQDRELEELRDVFEDLSLDASTVEDCRWVHEVSAVPLAHVLRAALPPGLDAGSYRVLHPAPDWPYERGDIATRTALRRTLGADRVKGAESSARIELSPRLPKPTSEEWTVPVPGATPDFGRAHSQRKLFDTLLADSAGGSAGGVRSSDLLAAVGATRATLLRLRDRGVIYLEKRPTTLAVQVSSGQSSARDALIQDSVESFAEVGGARVWRVPTAEQSEAVAAFAGHVVENGEQALILAPEIETVERLKDFLLQHLPGGYRIAAYHSELGRGRTAVHVASRDGGVDVIVGTRTAALLPLPRLGMICVVDEPNEVHRAAPGYEGLPIHARDIALHRAKIQDASVILLSPTPSLRVYGAGIGELNALPAPRWPAVQLVDMRGSGAVFSTSLLDACRNAAEAGGHVGVLVNRLGYVTAVSCNRCGAVRSCPVCDLPLALQGSGRSAALICSRCGHRETASEECPECGASRMSPTGLAAERVRAELREALDLPVGLITAGNRDQEDAPIIVGTLRLFQERPWDVVCVPDADSLIQGIAMGAVERGFRALYRAAEASRERLVVQTRSPEHYALQAALRGDYRGFAAAELPRLRSLGYPPYAHLAEVVIEGPKNAVRDAVESRLSPALPANVGMSMPVALPGRANAWRVLLRASERRKVARAAKLAVRLVGRGGLKVLVDVDPEEV